MPFKKKKICTKFESKIIHIFTSSQKRRRNRPNTAVPALIVDSLCAAAKQVTTRQKKKNGAFDQFFSCESIRHWGYYSAFAKFVS